MKRKIHFLLGWALVAACSPSKNDSHPQAILAITTETSPHNYVQYEITIEALSLINVYGKTTDIALHKPITANLTYAQPTLYDLVAIPIDDYRALKIRVNTHQLTLMPDIELNGLTEVELFDGQGSPINKNNRTFTVTVPLNPFALSPTDIATLNIHWDVDASTTLLYKKDNRLGIALTPTLSSTLYMPRQIILAEIPYQLHDDKITAYIHDRELNIDITDTDDSENKISLDWQKPGTITLVGALSLINKEPFFKANKVTHHPTLADDRAGLKGILHKLNDNWHLLGTKTQSQQKMTGREHRLVMTAGTQLTQPALTENRLIQPDHLKRGQRIEARANLQLEAEDIVLKPTEWVVSVSSIDIDAHQITAKPWLIDNWDAQYFFDREVTVDISALKAAPQTHQLLRLTGFALSEGTDFSAVKAEIIALDNLQLKMLFTDTDKQQLYWVDNPQGAELMLSESMRAGLLIETKLTEVAIHIQRPIKSFTLENTGQFTLQLPLNAAKSVIEEYSALAPFKERLMQSMATYRLLHLSATGRWDNDNFAARAITLSFSSDTSEPPHDNQLITVIDQSNLPRGVKETLISAGVIGGVLGLYGLAYWFTQHQQKPVLGALLTRIFLPGTDSDDRRRLNAHDLIDRRERILWKKGSKETIEIGEYAPRSTTADNETVLVYFGGNAEDNMTRSDFLDQIAEETQCKVMTMNYPGFGRSDGKRSFDSALMAAESFVDHLQNEKGFRQIIPIGWSYGGAIATQVAEKYQSPLLYLNSTFSSTKNAANSVTKQLIKPLVSIAVSPDTLNSAMTLESIKHQMDVIISHGTQDQIIDYKHAIKLAESSNKNKNLNTQLHTLYQGEHWSSLNPNQSFDAQNNFIQQVHRLKTAR